MKKDETCQSKHPASSIRAKHSQNHCPRLRPLHKQLLLILSFVLIAFEGIAQDTIFPWDCPRYITKGRPTEGYNYDYRFGNTTRWPGVPQIIGHSLYAPEATVYGLAVSIEHTGWACSTDHDQMNHIDNWAQ